MLRKQVYDSDPEKFRARARDYVATMDPERREQHRQRAKVSRKQAYDANPEKFRVRQITVKYGLSAEDYAQLIEDTGPNCPLCGVEFKSRGRAKRCVDHDHDTGNVRGMICMSCNFALGQFGDDPDTILRAIAYLGRHA